VAAFILILGLLCCTAIVLSRNSKNQLSNNLVELQYDNLGSRLKCIGDFDIQYGFFGGRPVSLGSAEIGYDNFGTRLKYIGNAEIEYDMLDSRPKWLDNMKIQYDMLGSRLSSIGGMAIHYDMIGSRPKWLGDMEIQYDMLGSRPRYIRLPDSQPTLSREDLIITFFVLYERKRKIKRQEFRRQQARRR
jgi:hypothetical protein